MQEPSPLRPKIIASTGTFWMWPLDRTFGTLAEAGFEAAELMVTRDPRTQSAQAPGTIAAQEGMKIVALHAPMLVVTRRVWGPNFLSIIERSTEVAKALEADIVVVHPPYVWELQYQRWLLNELDRFSADNGVAIAVENMFRLWLGGTPVRGHRWVSPADLERFTQLTLDTSHCGVDGYDILEALDRLRGRLAHIHLSDSVGDHRDNHAFPGEGTLPLAKFVGKLAEVGFQGSISLELDVRPLIDDPSRLTQALIRAREFCEENLS
ncbi:MAG: sugar phosphate isomerase/epimerase family protein [Actinomycetota bacterium]|nr:sugar phosphate isomerase/epimerase [Actinomycetota bacterium]